MGSFVSEQLEINMRYYHGERSVGLFPIVLALSAVFVLGFTILYLTVGQRPNASQTESQTESTPDSQSAKPIAGSHGHA